MLSTAVQSVIRLSEKAEDTLVGVVGWTVIAASALCVALVIGYGIIDNWLHKDERPKQDNV